MAPGTALAGLVAVDHPDVRVEAVKLADDRSGDVIVRLYESAGGRASAALRAAFPVAGAREVDLLERDLPDGRAGVGPRPDGAVGLALRPFQIATVRLGRADAGADVAGIPVAHGEAG